MLQITIEKLFKFKILKHLLLYVICLLAVSCKVKNSLMQSSKKEKTNSTGSNSDIIDFRISKTIEPISDSSDDSMMNELMNFTSNSKYSNDSDKSAKKYTILIMDDEGEKISNEITEANKPLKLKIDNLSNIDSHNLNFPNTKHKLYNTIEQAEIGLLSPLSSVSYTVNELRKYKNKRTKKLKNKSSIHEYRDKKIMDPSLSLKDNDIVLKKIVNQPKNLRIIKNNAKPQFILYQKNTEILKDTDVESSLLKDKNSSKVNTIKPSKKKPKNKLTKGNRNKCCCIL